MTYAWKSQPLNPVDAEPLASGAREQVYDNPAWARARPVLSVLTPFFRDNPTNLLTALEREAEALGGKVELIALDDCGGDADLTETVRLAMAGMTAPARLIAIEPNEGRAKGRNRLARHARARHLLFLDADMLPDSPDFLARYLEQVEGLDAPVVFGGFSVEQASNDPIYALHRALAGRAECLPAATRAEHPEKYVFTSNLLVRRDVFEAEAFDESFTGWGWEDVEWGMRVAARYGVAHIDNPATHLGLDSPAVLAGKYEQSAENFARVVARHPEVVSTYPSYKMARAMKRIPGLPAFRALLKRAALNPLAPLSSRVIAMKAYRAALYAEVV